MGRKVLENPERENPQKCKVCLLQAQPDPQQMGIQPLPAPKSSDAIWVTILSASFLTPSPVTEGALSFPRQPFFTKKTSSSR